MPRPMTTKQLQRLFGRFRWSAAGRSAIRIEEKWVRENIITIFIPELVDVPTFGGHSNGRVRFHRMGVEPLQRAFAECEAAGVGGDILFWGGSFVPRRIRGSRSLSRHSWGTAFDVNTAENPFRRPPARAGKPGNLYRVAPIFEKHGFSWGGRWRTKDGMHFELAALKDYEEVKPPPKRRSSGVRLKISDVLAEVAITLRDGASYCAWGELAAALGLPCESPELEVPVAQILKSEGYVVTWHGDHGPKGTIYAYEER